jgi:hypothetical protein
MAQNTQMTRVQRVQWLEEVYINTVLPELRAPGNLLQSHTAACDFVLKKRSAEILEVFPAWKNLPDNLHTPKQDPSRTKVTKGAAARMVLPGLYKKLQGLMQG